MRFHFYTHTYRNDALVGFIFSFVFFPFTIGLQPTALAQPQNNLTHCKPLARIFPDPSRPDTGAAILCEGEHLSVLPYQKVTLLCYATGQQITLSGETLLNAANPCQAKQTTEVLCRESSSALCSDSNLRGKVGLGEPTLLSPYSNRLLSQRPILSWLPVKGAKHYIVTLSDAAGEIWEINTTGTTLPYPGTQLPLEPATTYYITVDAIADQFISSATLPIETVSEAEAQEITTIVKLVESTVISLDEQAYLDLNAIYSSRNLVTEALAVLQERVKAGSNHPGVYRALGDIYRDLKLTDAARTYYRQAIKLGQQSGNDVEKEQAELSLESMSASIKPN
jgi:tetratricopeptide (TPR) repeat protein